MMCMMYFSMHSICELVKKKYKKKKIEGIGPKIGPPTSNKTHLLAQSNYFLPVHPVGLGISLHYNFQLPQGSKSKRNHGSGSSSSLEESPARNPRQSPYTAYPRHSC